MSLAQTIRADMEKSLKGGDKLRCSVLRLVLSAINYAEIAQQKTLDDTGVLAVISKEAKQRRESIEAYDKGNRPDLVAKEKAELDILITYLPQQMSRDDIVAIAKKVIEEVGAKGPADKGKVMSKLMPQTKGRADGQEVNTIVTELLSKL
ncbi:MAG TPA: aspartyl-tRNA amidotransferase [Dehalococcoidia bacterium]|nr:aspartyl-tRNA amidotransferase [Dehalococcoidia bacterium]